MTHIGGNIFISAFVSRTIEIWHDQNLTAHTYHRRPDLWFSLKVLEMSDFVLIS